LEEKILQKLLHKVLWIAHPGNRLTTAHPENDRIAAHLKDDLATAPVLNLEKTLLLSTLKTTPLSQPENDIKFSPLKMTSPLLTSNMTSRCSLQIFTQHCSP
jgi:hypothetical protein